VADYMHNSALGCILSWLQIQSQSMQNSTLPRPPT